MHLESARNGPPEITLSAQALRTADFPAKVDAAAHAGFCGLGLSVEDYLKARTAGLDDTAMIGLLGKKGLRVTEVEFLSDWAPCAKPGVPSEKETVALHMARVFHADHVNAGIFQAVSLETAVNCFKELCLRAGDLKVALEFMPFGGIPDLRSAWEIVHRSGMPNGGLLIDTWHWTRAHIKPGDLVDIPAGRIFEIQLADVRKKGLPMNILREESLYQRIPPGRGYGDIGNIVTVLRNHDVNCMVAVEVMSEDLDSTDPAITAQWLMMSANAILEKYW